jgi:5-methylcytosine-specific restriction endonuclease McrA
MDDLGGHSREEVAYHLVILAEGGFIRANATGWRCQSCGTMSNLEVHHKQFRSHSGEDSEENLITLCTGCHSDMHC